MNTPPGGATNGLYSTKYGTGWDVDLIAGYDFGMIRLEAELGYKHAGIDGLEVRNLPLTGLRTARLLHTLRERACSFRNDQCFA